MLPGDLVRAKKATPFNGESVCMYYLPGPAGENSCGGSGDPDVEESGHMELGDMGLAIAVVDGECLVLWLDEGATNYGWQETGYFEVVT